MNCVMYKAQVRDIVEAYNQLKKIVSQDIKGLVKYYGWFFTLINICLIGMSRLAIFTPVTFYNFLSTKIPIAVTWLTHAHYYFAYESTMWLVLGMQLLLMYGYNFLVFSLRVLVW